KSGLQRVQRFGFNNLLNDLQFTHILQTDAIRSMRFVVAGACSIDKREMHTGIFQMSSGQQETIIKIVTAETGYHFPHPVLNIKKKYSRYSGDRYFQDGAIETKDGSFITYNRWGKLPMVTGQYNLFCQGENAP